MPTEANPNQFTADDVHGWRGQTGNTPLNMADPTPADRPPGYLTPRPTRIAPDTLSFPLPGIEGDGPAWPARMDVTTYTRRWDEYNTLGGDQARAPIPPQPAGIIGGQVPWSNWDPRTFRNLPTAGWDDPLLAAGTPAGWTSDYTLAV
jgi:hypothetical protein